MDTTSRGDHRPVLFSVCSSSFKWSAWTTSGYKYPSVTAMCSGKIWSAFHTCNSLASAFYLSTKSNYCLSSYIYSFLMTFLLISYFLRVRVAQTAVLVTVEDLSWNRYKFRQIYRDTNKWRQNAILLLLIFILS